ncbi:hypothetical protein Q31a_43060 [Aureliella helgolandensis]|uniref:Uncharacterized protein n=1 Tax=Aureliella helgolandensis TaxID=2527968 RepID=A0A518GBL6_9BACT|nr:hypothetical protein Q31a_43060 [Aureliella helgolandensis]
MRRSLALIAGVVSECFATMLLILATYLAYSGGPLRQWLVLAATAVYPALVGVACLDPPLRTVAIRLLGVLTFIAMTWVLIATYVNPNDNIGNKARCYYVAMCIASAYIAVKGRWPTPQS